MPAQPWAFHLHPDVVGICAFLLAGYFVALRRWGPLFHPRPDDPPASRKQRVAFVAGVVAFFAAVGWPVHDIAERYLYSAHMVQHLLLGLVAPPLLLLGTPEWLLRLVLGRGVLRRAYLLLTRPIVAAIAFNATLVLIHWPRMVDLMLASDVAHEALHLAFLISAVLMWSVLYSPLPEVAGRLEPPGRMLFLFVQTILPTVPASFLTFGTTPLYRVYETLPRLWGLSARDDMQLAGLLMKVGGGLLLWSIIAVMFFRWANREDVGGYAMGGGGSGGTEPSDGTPALDPARGPVTRWTRAGPGGGAVRREPR